MSERMFNDEQEGYMAYLATVPPEQKSYCGWYVGKCPHPECQDKGTNADKIASEAEAPRSGVPRETKDV